MTMYKIIFLDNKDSFSYNLVDLVKQLGVQVDVYRNDVPADFIFNEIKKDKKTLLMLSPGPGTPQDSGSLMPLLSLAVGSVPIIGICLGLQAIALHFGFAVQPAHKIVHGKKSKVDFQPNPLFYGIDELYVGRYHSLMAYNIQHPLEVIAWSDNIPMAIVHKTLPIVAFQFHPESILTYNGQNILTNSLAYLCQNKP